MKSELEKLRIEKHHKARTEHKVWWPWVALTLLILAAGAGIWKWRQGIVGVSVQTIRVRIPEGAANNADLVTLNATGYVMAAHKIELATKVIGRVAWVGVEMGDKITRGQQLVRLEDDEYKARVAEQQGLLDNAKARLAELEAGSRKQEIGQAESAVQLAEAELANAERNHKRLSELDDGRVVSKQLIDDASTLVKTRRAQLDSAHHQLDLVKEGPRKEQIGAQRATVRQLEGSLALAMVELDNTVIRSTVDGTVLGRNVEVGEFVTTGFVGDNGAKGYVVSIADLSDLRVELDISQNDFAKVLPKGPCRITTDAYPDRKYDGVVDLISPEANRQKATVQVRVKVLNPDALLKPDMNATVSFLSIEKSAGTQPGATTAPAERPSLRVPASAVANGSVFVVEDGKAVARTVSGGQTDTKGNVEIRMGLIGGEDLIVNPPASLKAGDRVHIEAGPE